MDFLIEAISQLIGRVIVSALIGGSIFLFAGEIRLAALRKASQGSVKLSTFTSEMTANSHERK